MGIDFRTHRSHASWSYGGFHDFRTRLAAHIGINNYDAMEGTTIRHWHTLTDSPLVPLLAHSDCDGLLTTLQCAQVAAPLLSAVMELWGSSSYDWHQGTELVRCMLDCVAENTPLEFR